MGTPTNTNIIQKDNLPPAGTPDSILIIDDDAINRKILGKIFSNKYQICEAEDGCHGLAEILTNRNRFVAVLLDVVMPGMNGVQVLEHLRGMDLLKKTPVFLITAEQDEALVKQAYDLGVMDVIVKPVQSYIVRRRVDSVIELFRARRELNTVVQAQQVRLQKQTEQIQHLNQGMIEALATAIEFRSQETGGHVQRISSITRFVLENSSLGKGLSAEDIDHITQASILHDIGKIMIPDAILAKPGKFTPEEYDAMKLHTVKGAHLLESVPQLRDTPIFEYAYDIALHHHERWDGRGYPDGLIGDQITPWAQVVSLADVYDALSCKRVYKEAFSHSTVLSMILGGQCGVFSPLLLDSFFAVEDHISQMYHPSQMPPEPVLNLL